jgi:hypothetical protein
VAVRVSDPWMVLGPLLPAIPEAAVGLIKSDP